MKKILTAFIVLICIQVSAQSEEASDALPEAFQLIPSPQNIELTEGEGLRFGDLSALKLEGITKRPVMGATLTRLPETKDLSEGVLTLKMDSSSNMPESHEGYVLTVSNGKVVISSRGEAGLFYGCQTLEQLLEDARDNNMAIPACKITDFPAFEFRSVHFDLKHHLDHMNYYYESIDRLARYKINSVVVEFEDKLRYQRQPLVGAPQAISIDEMAALTNYARERHIEVNPLVQGLGHASFILKHQQYEHLRELKHNRWAFCPLHEGTYQVLFDMYRDAMEATPGSRYIHIGGDEIGTIGVCPRCKPTADAEGKLALNLYWLKRVCEFAEENGRIPIFWDDMPLKEAGVYATTHKVDITEEQATEMWKEGSQILEELIPEFPKNCIYMRWQYSRGTQPGNIMALDWYKNHNLNFMVSTAAQVIRALLPSDTRLNIVRERGAAAIKSFGQIAYEKGAIGTLCTAWDDASAHFETYWHGFITSAEYTWSPYKRSLEEFDYAWMQREFGIPFRDYHKMYRKLTKAAEFWEMAFNQSEDGRIEAENALFNLPGLAHWLPPKDPDAPIKTDFSDVLIPLPDLDQPGKWSTTYADRLETAKQIMDDYQYTSVALEELYRTSKDNRYHWEVISAVNDFQVTASKLMLALGKSDTRNKNQRKEGIEEIKAAMEDFEEEWENLKVVYSKTRFIEYPSNYVPDRYFHFASQREDLSWMIQVEELYHKMIHTWMEENGFN